MSLIRTSKFLSLVLRHNPGRIGISLDRAGWTEVDALLAACAARGVRITRAELEEVVASSDKQRFALSPDGTQIRANQGHSVAVELGLAAVSPPPRLYHGTVAAALPGIRAEGLVKRARHHVHLSAEPLTATKVGSRRGAPVLLSIRAADMSAAGHAFYRSENGVWLTDQVPPEFIEFPDSSEHQRRANRRGQMKEIAETTLAACEAGAYDNAAGARVELAASIMAAAAGTRLYEQAPALPAIEHRRAGTISVTAETTVEAIGRLTRAAAAHVGCLNFASAKNPGGGFLGGAVAQEEALARSSALYPCLLKQLEYYERNRAHRSPLYLDLAIFSPRVPFFRDDAGGWLDAPALASVITCPAPNAGALRQQRAGDAAEIERTLQRRAALVLAIAAAEGITTLVLGAWGAGVFGNDPAVVAEAFAVALEPMRERFHAIVFAVPPGPNHAAFATRFWITAHAPRES